MLEGGRFSPLRYSYSGSYIINLDIPYECQYVTTANQTNAYQLQMIEYGIDTLISSTEEKPTNHLPLINHPDFKANTYCTIQEILSLDGSEMANAFMTTLLQTQIRNCEHLANLTRKQGSKTQSYAAVTAERLPIKHQPKAIPNLQPTATIPTTTATILTITEKKYTEALTFKPRYKSIETYTETLPRQLRKRFTKIFNEITHGFPNHQELRGCPLSTHPEKRTQFQKAAPNKPPTSNTATTYKELVEAYKSIKICAKCGRNRTLATERQHKQCSTHFKQCSLSWTPQCRTDQCNHALHSTQSIWRSEVITIQAEPKLLNRNTQNHF